MKQSSYTIQDLIKNDSFRRMVKGDATIEEIEQWDEWIEASRYNRKLAKKATAEITEVEFKDSDVPDIQEEWKKISLRTVEREKIRTLNKSPKIKNGYEVRKIIGIAASFLMAVFLGIVLYLTSNPADFISEQTNTTDEVVTGPNERKTIKLSDGSTIILNSNSAISYTDGWVQDEAVQVTLQGEAFFHVIKRTSPDQPEFQVITPDGIIYDMGTKFVVTVQEDYSSVVLQEGWVQVRTEIDDDIQKSADVHVGEMLEFNKTDLFQKKKVNPTFYSSWATGVVRFDDTDVGELAEYLEQEFDITVVVESNKISEKVIIGAIHYRSLEDLLSSVSTILEVPVYRSAENDTFYISSQYNND